MTDAVVSQSKLYAGIEAGGTKFNCVVGTSPTNIIAQAKFPTTTPEETLSVTRDFFNEQIAAHGRIEALGIASFGPVDLHKDSATYGYITATPKKYWSNTDVVGFYQREFNVPVEFDTDVNGSALGEFLYGAAQGFSDFIYITIGTGIGGGVFANGKPLNGMAHPEIGHMFIPRDMERDAEFEGFCPFHDNCLTDLACGPAIEARWKTSAVNLPEDHVAWDLQAHYLAIMCVNVVMAYSPKRIILGGGVMDQTHLFGKIHKNFVELMNGYMMPSIPVEDYIVPPALPGHSGEVGSIALAIQAAS